MESTGCVQVPMDALLCLIENRTVYRDLPLLPTKPDVYRHYGRLDNGLSGL